MSLSLSSGELFSLVQRGLVGFQVEPNKEVKRFDISEYEKERCKENRKLGLTIKGKPRKRPWTHLTGYSKEQKMERRRVQQREAMRKLRAK